jgi:hypothetical protein
MTILGQELAYEASGELPLPAREILRLQNLDAHALSLVIACGPARVTDEVVDGNRETDGGDRQAQDRIRGQLLLVKDAEAVRTEVDGVANGGGPDLSEVRLALGNVQQYLNRIRNSVFLATRRHAPAVADLACCLKKRFNVFDAIKLFDDSNLAVTGLQPIQKSAGFYSFLR